MLATQNVKRPETNHLPIKRKSKHINPTSLLTAPSIHQLHIWRGCLRYAYQACQPQGIVECQLYQSLIAFPFAV